MKFHLEINNCFWTNELIFIVKIEKKILYEKIGLTKKDLIVVIFADWMPSVLQTRTIPS